MLFSRIFVCFVGIEFAQLIRVPTSWTNLKHGTYVIAKQDKEKSKPLPASTALKSYVQVRKGIREQKVPKRNRKLNRALKDSKIYTVFIEDGFYNRDFDHGLLEEHKRGHENLKRFKRFGNEKGKKCMNDNEIITQDFVPKRVQKMIKNRAKYNIDNKPQKNRKKIRNLENMIDCLKNENFGKTPLKDNDKHVFRNKTKNEKNLEIIENHFNKLLQKYNKKGNLRIKRSPTRLQFKKKHGILSEVYYKDEMNQNQQNAIFEDVRKHFDKTKTNQSLGLRKYLEKILEEFQTTTTKTNLKIVSKKPNNIVIRKIRLQRNEIEGLQPPILSLTTTKPKKNRVKRFKKSSIRIFGNNRKFYY